MRYPESEEIWDGHRVFLSIYKGHLGATAPAEEVIEILDRHGLVLTRKCLEFQNAYLEHQTADCYAPWVKSWEALTSVRTSIRKHYNLYCIVKKGYSLN